MNAAETACATTAVVLLGLVVAIAWVSAHAPSRAARRDIRGRVHRIVDLVLALEHLGTRVPELQARRPARGARGRTRGVCADLDGNGSVNGADLAILLGAWGACAP